MILSNIVNIALATIVIAKKALSLSTSNNACSNTVSQYTLMSTTSFTTCVCLSLARKGISSATVNPCTLLLMMIWYTNFVLYVLNGKAIVFQSLLPT